MNSPTSNPGTDTIERPRFLIVDDDALPRIHLASLLSISGDCDTASNGEEAIAAFSRAHDLGVPYNVVFLDVMMPRMDGQETLIAIRNYEAQSEKESTPVCNVIMVSSSHDPNDVVESFKNKCDGFLNKPVFQTDLAAKLETIFKEISSKRV